MVALKKYVRRYTSLSSLIDILRRKQIALLDPQTWDDRNDRYFMELYRKKKKIQSVYAFCASTESETYHHWRVFTSKEDGICIEFHREKLESLLEAHGTNIRFEEVKYMNLAQAQALAPRHIDRLPFVKRRPFAPEREYRVIAEVGAPQSTAYLININLDCIYRVTINPWLPASLADSVIQTIKEIDGCIEINFIKSRLIDSAMWKKIGDKIAGISSP